MTSATNRRPPKAPRQSAAEGEVRDLRPILDRVRPLTTTNEDTLIDLARLVRTVLAWGIPGDFVECGCYAGGAGFLMAHLLREAGVRDRKVWLFDSFEGLPPPQAIDGAAALEYAANAGSPENYDNCRASFEGVRQTAAELGLAPYVECVKGWFDQTLPAHRGRVGPIGVLRVDGNWYSSVRCCLETLYDQVVDDGFVLFHTYYTYDGCAKAVHEFLGGRCLPYRIEAVVGTRPGEAVEDYQSALLHKGELTWKWMRHVYLAAREIEALVPPGETFILADEAALGMVFGGGRRALPFPEEEGEYAGPPEDDATATRELERLRQVGAHFLALVWPAFWWLEYYAGFHRHLRERFRCVLDNDRLVLFDLRQTPAETGRL
jgi:hypothetical protein